MFFNYLILKIIKKVHNFVPFKKSPCFYQLCDGAFYQFFYFLFPVYYFLQDLIWKEKKLMFPHLP